MLLFRALPARYDIADLMSDRPRYRALYIQFRKAQG
jgi:hypothetical protein